MTKHVQNMTESRIMGWIQKATSSAQVMEHIFSAFIIFCPLDGKSAEM